MKIASSGYAYNGGKEDKSVILPLVPKPERDVPSEQKVTHTLRSTPADADSPKYKITIRVLIGDEDCREVLVWHRQALRVLNGLNVTTHSAAIPIVESLIRGTPLSLFREGVQEAKAKRLAERVDAADDADKAGIATAGPDHANNLNWEQVLDGMKHVVTQLLPRRVYARVKRYLRRECRKPREMKVRVYLQHMLRMNQEEIPNLPPFEARQSLSTDELLDIILFGTPKSWQKEMERQGFDPMDNTVAQVIEFMERQEATEEDFNDNNQKDSKPAAKKGGNGKKKNSSSKPATKKNGYCLLHGDGNHDTEDCFTLQKEAKRLKGEGGDSKPAAKSKNKTWSKKAEEAKEKAKGEYHAFVRKEIAKGVKKQIKKDLSAFTKKRKKDDSDSSDDDLAAFDLKDFNYEDMDNLKIDDETSVEC